MSKIICILEYHKKYSMEGVKYRAIWNRIKKGQLKIEKTPTGRVYIIIDEEKEKRTAIYCRVSSAENKDNLERQKERLLNYCYASGNIMRKAIPNCLTTNGIEGFVVSPVRITPKGYYPYKQVS